jgi:NTP pyrophosphatase (non-canonical NTP hydrolase)
LTLPALQAYVARVVEKRNFTRDPDRIFILLAEEVGELATEFKHWIYDPPKFDPENLVDLANVFSLALMERWPGHEARNDARYAARRQGRHPRAHVAPEMTLAGLVAHVEAKRRERAFEDTPERLLILLTEQVGEIATELRKGWKGQGDSGALGEDLIDALIYLFRLAGSCRIDLEEAVRAKERANAGRTWQY